MNDNIYQLVEEKLLEWKLNTSKSPIVLGVSGGVDSMVMLYVLSRITQKNEYKQVQWIVAHFNHNLRDTSDRDMLLVKEYAESLNLPYFVGYWSTPCSVNVEANAREARYKFLGEVAKSTGSHTLMTAHHLSDQVETHLMRLVRGTSIKGWNGISEDYERRIKLDTNEKITLRVLRPLLKISKDDIYSFAEIHNIPYFEDETNHSNHYLRNRIRHEVVPILQTENPQFLNHVDQMIAHLNLSYDAHYEQFIVLEPELAAPNQEGGWTLNLENWWKLSQSTFSIYLRILFEERIVFSLGKYSQMMIEQLEKMMARDAQPNTKLNIGNQWIAEREYNVLKIKPEQIIEEQTEKKYVLNLEKINQWQQISENEFIGIYSQDKVTNAVENGTTMVYHLNLNDSPMPCFEIRHRHPGDFMEFLSKDNKIYHKKLRRIFIDEKVTAFDRETTWLVTNGGQQVYWAIGIKKGYFNLIENEQEISHSILYQKRKN